MFGKIVYTGTIFLSAFLLFQIQPLVAKMILPWFGGAAAVWITCMLFFQLVLLGGYVYAHWLINSLAPKRQLAVHLVLLAASLAVLPIAPDRALLALGGLPPAAQLLLLLLTSVGAPYLLLASTTPLLQSWYARTFQNALPYRLFALSNFASLLGLLAYPFVVEPVLSLPQQSWGWSGLYALFAAACITAAVYSLRRRADATVLACEPAIGEPMHVAPQPLEPDVLEPVALEPGAPKFEIADSDAAHAETAAPDIPDLGAACAPTGRDKLLWLALSACSSVMLLAVTNYLTQNLASIPFLWILPLALYLLSFTLCFDRSGWYRNTWYVWFVAVLLGGMAAALTQWQHELSLRLSIPLFCAGLFAVCMFCHGELAARKPAPRHLTVFYLILSAGGALGGVLIGLGAPVLLSGPFELTFGLTACALLLYGVNRGRNRVTSAACVLVVAGVVAASAVFIFGSTRQSRLQVRNFYGCLKVDDYNGEYAQYAYRCLVHGTIVHGTQFLAPERRHKAIAYYGPASGVGLALNTLEHLSPGPHRVGVIGLGAGTLAAYARPGDTFRFYEINPLVQNVARRQFTYLADCQGQADVLLGDARLSMERQSDQGYDLLVVDAFSSDSIPVHLLTLEALQLYFRHLKPDGVLALHISNHHLDLAPVVEALRAALGKQALLVTSEGREEDEIYDTDWVLLASNRKLLDQPELKAAGTALSARPGLKVWTDTYSNLIEIMRL